MMKILVPFKSVPIEPYAGARRHAQVGHQPFRRDRDRGSASNSRTRRSDGNCGGHDRSAGDRRTNPLALAMGVDRALRIDDARALDPYAVARILRAVVEKEAPQVVLMGKQAVDDDSNQVGQMLAGLLGWPQATFVSKIEFLENKTRARCTRETDGGLEVVDVNCRRLSPPTFD